MAGNKLEQGLNCLGDRARAFYDKNKAHIFTGIGIGGTIVTGILAAQSGARSARKIDKREKELGRKLSFIEKGQLCWTDAIPPIVVGGVACYSEWKSDRLFTDELTKKTAMLIASEKAYEKLSEKTKEVLGEKKAKQVQDEITKEKVTAALDTGVLSLSDFEHCPRVGNGQLSRYVDGYSMLPVWTNPDYIALQVKEMQQMMAELKPRGGDDDYYDKKVGVCYREWLHRIGYSQIPRIADTPERRKHGWNKGFAADGSDDDEIDYTISTMEWAPGIAVCVINWTKVPTDMSLGRLIKSSGVVA